MNSIVKLIHASSVLDDVNVNQLHQEITNILTGGANTVLLDLGNVTFMDSFGLIGLLSVLTRVRSAGDKLFLCSLNTQLKMVFELSQVERVFEIFANQDEFNKIIS